MPSKKPKPIAISTYIGTRAAKVIDFTYGGKEYTLYRVKNDTFVLSEIDLLGLLALGLVYIRSNEPGFTDFAFAADSLVSKRLEKLSARR